MTNSVLYRLKAIDEASKVIEKVNSKLKETQKQTVLSFKSVQTALNNTANSVSNLSNQFLAIGAVGTVALGYMGKTIYNFEQQVNAMSAVSGLAREEIQGLVDKAKELGRTTEHSASAAASAGVNLLKMGFNVKESMALMGDALKLATAGQLSMAESSELLGVTIKSYGFDIAESTRIVDVFAKAAASGNLTVAETQELMSKAGAIANISGVDFEYLVASFISVRDRGIEAGSAARGISASIARFAKPTKEARKALKSLGVDFNVIKKQGGGFKEIIEALARTQMTEAHAVSIFGLEHVKTGLSLVQAAKSADKLAESLKNAQTFAEKAQLAYLQGLPGAVMLFRSVLEGLILELGEAGLTKAMIRVIGYINSLITYFSNLSASTKKTIVVVLGIISAMFAFGIALKVLAFSISGLSALLIVLKGALIAIKIAFFAWQVVNWLVGVSLGVIGLSLSPILIGIIAIVTALAGLYFAYKKIKSLITGEEMDIGGDFEALINTVKNFNITNMMKGSVDINVKSEQGVSAEVTNLEGKNMKLGVQN